MKTSLYILSSLTLVLGLCLLSGCGGRGLVSLYSKSADGFPASAARGHIKVHARFCSHDEIQASFSAYEDFYHYYYLLHIRVENAGFERYSFQADHQHFFIPPELCLKKYTQSSAGSYGMLLSAFIGILLLPVYAFNVTFGTVENPARIDPGASGPIIIPRHFAFLTSLYAGSVLTPLVVGSVSRKARESARYSEATRLIVMQHGQRVIFPYKSRDFLVMVPRANISLPLSLVLFNHHTQQREQFDLALTHPL